MQIPEKEGKERCKESKGKTALLWVEKVGGHMSNFRKGCSSYFFGFKIWSNSIFVFCQIFDLFFWVSQIFRYFFGFHIFPAIFLGLPIFVWHTRILSNDFLHFASWVILFIWVWILGHFIFLGLNLESFCFYG